MRDPVHASDLGQQLVFELVSNKLQALYDDHLASGRRSFAPKWLLEATLESDSVRHRAVSGDGSYIIPLPLPPPSQANVDAKMVCHFTDQWMDEAATSRKLAVNTSVGWQYGSHTHLPRVAGTFLTRLF